MSQTLASSTRARARVEPAVRRAAQPPRRASGATAVARSAPRAPRPSLRVVAAPVADRHRTAFVIGCLLLLVGGLFALLLINISLAQGSFRLHELQAQSRQLSDTSQALGEDIALQASPGQLSVRAAGLGMVPSGSVAFLRLSDGRVLGVAKPAPGATAPTVAAAAAGTDTTSGAVTTSGATPTAGASADPTSSTR